MSPIAPRWLKPDTILMSQLSVIYDHFIKSYSEKNEFCFFEEQQSGLSWIQMKHSFAFLALGAGTGAAVCFLEWAINHRNWLSVSFI